MEYNVKMHRDYEAKPLIQLLSMSLSRDKLKDYKDYFKSSCLNA